MKKLLFSILAATMLAPTFGATAVVDNLEATNTVVISTPLVLDSITLYSTNATPTIVRLIDGDLTTVTAAWTNYITYQTNLVRTYINTLGTTNITTNSLQYVQLEPHAAATNATTPILTIVVPADGGMVTFEPPSPIVFTSKLNLSNNLMGVSGIVSYRTQ